MIQWPIRSLIDDEFPWDNKSEKKEDTKYPYVCHSELNANLNFTFHSLKGCRLYVTLFTFNECDKALIQSCITQVIYRDNLYPDSVPTITSKKMFKVVGIKITKYKSENKEIKLTI